MTHHGWCALSAKNAGPSTALPLVASLRMTNSFAEVAVVGMMLWSCDDSYGGVGGAVVEEPAVVEADEAFGEGGPGYVLAGLLVWALGFEGGGVGAGDEAAGVVGVEEGFAGGVGVGSEGGVAVVGVVLAVVEDDDAFVGEDGWRADLREADVEVAGALGEDFDGVAGFVFDGGPVDEVGGGGEANDDLAPVHPVFAVDLCGDEAVAI